MHENDKSELVIIIYFFGFNSWLLYESDKQSYFWLTLFFLVIVIGQTNTNMSVVPICCKMPYRDQTPQIQRSTRHSERGFTSLQARTDSEHRRRSFSGLDSQRTTVRYSSSESPTNEKQLKSLASYFGKLQNVKTSNSSDSSSSSSSSYSKETIASDQHSAKKELKILDSYLDKLDKGKTKPYY